MNSYYYVDASKQKAGPVSPEDFKRLGITAQTLVWTKGMKSWTKAGEIPELSDFLEQEKHLEKPVDNVLSDNQTQIETASVNSQEQSNITTSGSVESLDEMEPIVLARSAKPVQPIPTVHKSESSSMGLIWSVSFCFKHYVDFTGRARRSEYWWWMLCVVIANYIPYAGLVLLLVMLVPTLAVSARRLHDTGRSGWWQLVGLVPIVGTIVMIYFCCQDSELGRNKWGENPKSIGQDAAVA
ncbi:MAG: DUF805 domain-containing protein [Bacteroidales bacterium]|jgi:uncharacterized membrane protein YhaH (DUF805 family)|nr:DUF805 domain-containing protein [Bacteroidales bacterium]